MASDYAPTPVEDFLDPDHPALFPRLTPEQIEYLAEIGTQLTFARGDVVFEHGQRETPLYVVRSGAIDIIDHAPEGDRYSPSAGRERSPPTFRCSPASRPSPAGTRPSRARSWRSHRRMCAGSSRPRPS